MHACMACMRMSDTVCHMCTAITDQPFDWLGVIHDLASKFTPNTHSEGLDTENGNNNKHLLHSVFISRFVCAQDWPRQPLRRRKARIQSWRGNHIR